VGQLASSLSGRAAVLRQVLELMDAGRSVLLFGPEGIGKSAIIQAVVRAGTVIVDPFERITRPRACQMRRALDHGIVHLAASRVSQGPELGAVGRVLWRFSIVRVRELPDGIIRGILLRELRAGDDSLCPQKVWVNDLVRLAAGRPGFAIAMGRFAAEWHRRHA
jgi:hypothetical protein